VDFVKMQGLGNDFVVLVGPAEVTADQVRSWCHRRLGIGADGVLVATGLGGAVRMEYWNADGSPSEMCGNGLRCVARLAFDRGWTGGRSFTVEAPAGPRPVEVREDGTVRALLGTVTDPGVAPFEMAGYRVTPAAVGNPHAVIVVDDCYTTPVEAVGPLVETDPHFPERTNVEFATVIDPGRVALRVWERGVGETLACGSGAAAAVSVLHAAGRTRDAVTVELPGGPLLVTVEGDGVWIEGPAEYVFAGTM
jgi:diaminopimelate epimerase